MSCLNIRETSEREGEGLRDTQRRMGGREKQGVTDQERGIRACQGQRSVCERERGGRGCQGQRKRKKQFVRDRKVSGPLSTGFGL